MDGTEAEERRKDGSVVVSYMPSLNEVTHFLQTGASDAAETSQVNPSIDSMLSNFID